MSAIFNVNLQSFYTKLIFSLWLPTNDVRHVKARGEGGQRSKKPYFQLDQIGCRIYLANEYFLQNWKIIAWSKMAARNIRTGIALFQLFLYKYRVLNTLCPPIELIYMQKSRIYSQTIFNFTWKNQLTFNLPLQHIIQKLYKNC